ncbi:hypothetical protein RBH26_07320 [Natronolimnohabitans sp. A-GB9]|uniref:hypothetical protein n=1 Tax=Natronolimnohabitans sp. A-GB9 TaxID=3069757 RepID=UPI0027B83F14|nr:hypothetical protein [Natronolimnohabitans sp. A-GB9]MDQ2050293.1 hypothetical protein [Natronolimnohabitans sp. A-GB9]
MLQLAPLPLQFAEEEMPPTEVLLVSLLIAAVLAVVVGYWVYRDASKRENNELLWALGVGFLMLMGLLFGAIAVVAYLLFRSDVTEPELTQGEPADDDWGATPDERMDDEWDRTDDETTTGWESPEEDADDEWSVTDDWDSPRDDRDSSRDENDDRSW